MRLKILPRRKIKLSGSFETGSAKASEAGKKEGQASGGSFEPGSDKAREAGQKGGSR